MILFASIYYNQSICDQWLSYDCDIFTLPLRKIKRKWNTHTHKKGSFIQPISPTLTDSGVVPHIFFPYASTATQNLLWQYMVCGYVGYVLSFVVYQEFEFFSKKKIVRFGNTFWSTIQWRLLHSTEVDDGMTKCSKYNVRFQSQQFCKQTL